MAFIRSGNQVLSFAEYQDVVDMDQRLFEENEGLTDSVVEDILIRSTQRLLFRFRSSDWWRETVMSQDSSQNPRALPEVAAEKIINRQSDFTDLCVYFSLAEFILPCVADFGNQDAAEVQKIAFYRSKFTDLWEQLITAADWYDYDDSGTVSLKETQPSWLPLRRVR